MNKNLWGWFYIILSPISLATAVLSFLRSGDTFIRPLPYLAFGILNLVLSMYYFKLGRAIKAGKEWANKWKFITLLIALLVLFFSFIYIYSLIFALLLDFY